MKKILSVILSVCMVITMLSALAVSVSADTLSQVIYTFDSDSKPASWTSDGANRYKIEIIDLSDSEDETDITHGNVLKFGTYGDLTNVGFSVPAGVYSTVLYARSSGSRATINIDINGTEVSTNLNTSVSGGNNNNKLFSMGDVTITETSNVAMTITTVNTGS